MTRMPLSCLLIVLLLASTPASGAVIAVSTDQLDLVFSESGDLLSARACIPECMLPDTRSVSLAADPAILKLDPASASPWNLERTESTEEIGLKFSSELKDAEYTWQIPRKGWTLRLQARGFTGLQLLSGAGFAGNPTHGFGEILERVRYVSVHDNKVITSSPEDVAGNPMGSPEWFGIRNRFWAVLISAENPVRYDNQYQAQPRAARIRMVPETADAMVLTVFIGPVEPSALEDVSVVLPSLMYSGLWTPLRWICQLLFHLIMAIHYLIPNWPMAIMLMSLSVHILMRPLSRAAERLQEDVNEKQALLEPRLKQIRKQFKGEQQAEQTLALYKSEGVHPLYTLKSLAGVMIVIPVFIGAFDMLAENIWLSGQSFLWIRDLSLPDSVATLPFSLPFLGNQLNVLPWLMTVLSVYASWLHQPAGHDREMHLSRNFKLLLMALAFLILFYTFPAGMVLYWTMNNLISVVKALFINYSGMRRNQAGQT